MTHLLRTWGQILVADDVDLDPVASELLVEYVLVMPNEEVEVEDYSGTVFDEPCSRAPPCISRRYLLC